MEVVVDGIRKHVQGDKVKDIVAKDTIVVRVDGELKDLDTPLRDGMNIQTFGFDSEEGKAVFWHSTAHLMAQAIKRLYPGAMLAIGPSIENGFYYDIDFGEYAISEKDFPRIEKKILELAREKQKFVREEVSKEEAIAYFTEKGDEYKLELISELADGDITFYKSGYFTDLCRGPHIPSSGILKYFNQTPD